MPFLAPALDPSEMEGRLREALGVDGLRLAGIRVVRHKPGKRCLIEYDAEWGGASRTILIGKVRARGTDRKSYAVQRGLWEAGFGEEGRFPVPRPLGEIPDLHMWLQRKEPGIVATEMLAGPEGKEIAKKVAELSHELHSRGVPPRRPPHTMEGELGILHERLPLVSGEEPKWRGRIDRILAACRTLGESLPEPEATPIHRDFYADQILVDGARLRLLDFDLYCEGDPGLDPGNFIAHMTEYAMRELGSPDALKDEEAALEERFVELSGEGVRAAMRVYAALTLARHIHISRRLPERRRLTADIICLCEERLLVGSGRRVFGI
jgi:hypothetical protein